MLYVSVHADAEVVLMPIFAINILLHCCLKVSFICLPNQRCIFMFNEIEEALNIRVNAVKCTKTQH